MAQHRSDTHEQVKAVYDKLDSDSRTVSHSINIVRVFSQS